MHKADRACPSEDVLLRLTSGELSHRRIQALEAHVRGCPRCRTTIEAWLGALDGYRLATSDAHAESDTPHWRTFESALLAENPASPPWWRPQARQVVQFAAVVLVGLVGIGLRPRHVEVALNAEVLIARAADHDDVPVDVDPSRVAIHVVSDGPPAHARVTPASAAADTAGSARHEVATGQLRLPVQPQLVAEQGDVTRELSRRLTPHAFDWRTPLSARPFQHWRDSVARPRDAVEWLSESLVRVSTSAESGGVRQAELFLRVPAFRPVRQVWRFADGLDVDLRSTDLWPLTPAESAPTPVEAEVPSARPAARPPVVRLAEVELEARIRLDELGLSVGRDLRIREADDAVIIEGRIPSPALAGAVAAYARSAGPVRAGVDASPSDDMPVPEVVPAGVDAWLNRTFPDPTVRHAYVTRARALHHDVADSAIGIADLLERYAAEVRAQLSPPARQRLGGLVAAQYERLVVRFEALEQHVAPLTGTLRRRMFAAHPPDTWSAVALRQAAADLAVAVDAVLSESTPDRPASAEAFERHARDVLVPALLAFARGAAGEPATLHP